MAFFKKKKEKNENTGNSGPWMQGGHLEDPAPRVDMSDQEILAREKARKATKRHILLFSMVFAVLFSAMTYYFVSTAITNKITLFNNDYNHRDQLLASKNRRGNIYASDSETLLATTNVSVDENGNVVQTRQYPFGRVFAHVVGYADMGGSGIEKYSKYDLLHSDLPFSTKLTYDKRETAAERLYPGNNVITTLNAKLQQVAYDAMGNYEGAVIVTEPSTGRILAMVSKPDYDPNEISSIWERLLADNESGTLLNRATQGLYPPGSTFKIVDCIELLQENPDALNSYSYDCTGVFEKEGDSIHCYKYDVHGEVNLMDSFAESCNSSFANIGVNTLNAGSFQRTLSKLMFNSALPYDFEYSRSSVNDPMSVNNEALMQMSIGQGTTEMSPLHLNMITMAIANHGDLMKPHLIDELHDAKGRTIKTYESEKVGTLFTSEVSTTLTQLMRAVVTDGTATSFADRSYEAAGKTGSAEFDSDKNSHAWFTGFAPASNPEICVTVLIEGEGMGSSYAVPVARKIMDAYFGE